jgi:hypothetical protein
MCRRLCANGKCVLCGRTLLARVLLCLLMAAVAVSTASCCRTGRTASAMSEPEGIAIAYARAIWEEHDVTKAASLVCSDSPWRENTLSAWGRGRGEAKEFSVDTASAHAEGLAAMYGWVTSTDRANGISERKAVVIQFIRRYEGEAKWMDCQLSFILVNRNGNWCIEMITM